MNDEQLDESLSALVDGELPSARAERLLDRLLDDAQLRERWHRHHLIGAALSPQHAQMIVGDELATRISKALEAEPVPLRRPTRRASWTVGLAVAASVATVAVLVMLGVSTQQSTPPSVPPLAAVNSQVAARDSAPSVLSGVVVNATAPVVTQASGSALTRMTWNDARPAVEARLNGYLLDHNEYLADGVRGMLPYARVVGYDASN